MTTYTDPDTSHALKKTIGLYGAVLGEHHRTVQPLARDDDAFAGPERNGLPERGDDLELAVRNGEEFIDVVDVGDRDLTLGFVERLRRTIDLPVLDAHENLPRPFLVRLALVRPRDLRDQVFVRHVLELTELLESANDLGNDFGAALFDGALPGLHLSNHHERAVENP